MEKADRLLKINGIQEVVGSIPISFTIYFKGDIIRGLLCLCSKDQVSGQVSYWPFRGIK
jgi:hypothetical protein